MLICCFSFEVISFFFCRFVHGKWRWCRDVGDGGDGSNEGRNRKKGKDVSVLLSFFAIFLILTNFIARLAIFVFLITNAGDGGGKEHGVYGRPPW